MKKILLAFDGTNFSEGAFEFARRLNEIESVLVTGVFMPQVDYANLWSYAAAANAGAGLAYIPLLEDEESGLIKKNMEHFEELCQKNGIAYRLHQSLFDFALPEFKKESRFADVIILSGEIFYKGVIESNQFQYLKDALHATESPVLIVPELYQFPDNNILAYDGSEESVYAIKQFAYIFPELAKNPTVLVFAEDEEDRDFPSKQQIMELAAQHYKDLTFHRLELNPRKYFSTWINDRKGSVLISGSFGRSVFSQTFRKSFAAEIIKEHLLPVFVAHK
jgi:nucleotide-binding universal stress UspA family protein